MANFLTVTDCQHLDSGVKRVYNLTNKASVIEYPRLPTRSRFQFYDPRGNKVHTNAARVEMKQAVERHKKLWRFE
ncbi:MULTISPECIES: hypothetical protein [Serratia]|jgi:hypothetical protein|uniref:hypothetical protein n=1 Tax=Serratia TaxID=613 RepID=UPI0027E52109|nr:hypothetical protein [Serratia marcescens]MCH4263146.1 hypothetical protein [Serratia liquefaciens]MCI1213181.1 hypothetical protein [Serratia liquefaciens]MCI1234538.1 hypothetical protein [Serratia liquefaciens]MCI1250179.1 hypothetical protein [Serratia liquefaciens]MCI1806075.1 hypothetical protein [Serratia liquefaciens]